MKKVVVSAVSEDEIVRVNADIDGDDMITTQDIILIKRIIASAN